MSKGALLGWTNIFIELRDLSKAGGRLFAKARGRRRKNTAKGRPRNRRFYKFVPALLTSPTFLVRNPNACLGEQPTLQSTVQPTCEAILNRIFQPNSEPNPIPQPTSAPTQQPTLLPTSEPMRSFRVKLNDGRETTIRIEDRAIVVQLRTTIQKAFKLVEPASTLHLSIRGSDGKPNILNPWYTMKSVVLSSTDIIYAELKIEGAF